jgi:CheY-like chemotaxis protein
MLTSTVAHMDLPRLTRLGFSGLLPKPVRIRQLIACLDRTLGCAPPEHLLESHLAPTPAPPTAVVRRYIGKVLLVEDNAVNQKVAQRFLERLGCQVVIADNGKHAVSKCSSEHFDLVLMDLQMPVMDGYVATSEIRALERTRSRTPIIALTASAMTGQLERCLAADMDGLLTKPLSVERLRETLERFGFGADPVAMMVRANGT